MGIEPTLPAWEAGALPLCYTRLIQIEFQFTISNSKGKLPELGGDEFSFVDLKWFFRLISQYCHALNYNYIYVVMLVLFKL